MKRVHCMREVFWYMSGERTSVYLTAELAASVEASGAPLTELVRRGLAAAPEPAAADVPAADRPVTLPVGERAFSWLEKNWQVLTLCGGCLFAGFLLGLLIFGSPWHLPPKWGDIPTWITGIATAALLFGAIITAIYAIRAFREQSKEVADQAAMLNVQSDQLAEQRKINKKQTKVLKLQVTELRESIDERKREADQRHRAQATRVFLSLTTTRSTRPASTSSTLASSPYTTPRSIGAIADFSALPSVARTWARYCPVTGPLLNCDTRTKTRPSPFRTSLIRASPRPSPIRTKASPQNSYSATPPAQCGRGG